MYLASNLPHMQTFGKVRGNFHVPCNETFTLARYMEISMYLATKHTSRYMEFSMYLAMKHMARYMEISMYLAMTHTARYVEISMYLAIKHMARYMEISKYLAMKLNARYMEISMYQLPYVSLQGTLKFPCTLQQNIWRNIACHMFRCRVPCQWYCEKVSLLPKET